MKDFLKSALLFISFFALLWVLSLREERKEQQLINTEICEKCGEAYENGGRRYGLCDRCYKEWAHGCEKCGRKLPDESLYQTADGPMICAECLAKGLEKYVPLDTLYSYFGVCDW